MNNIKIPTIEEVKTCLTKYGWQYRETMAGDGQDKAVLITPYALQNQKKGILLSLRIEGEFLMVSTVGFIKNVPASFSKRFLSMNDQIKLVKLFSIESDESEKLNVELGFELWAGAVSEETFFAFMDMTIAGIEDVLESLTKENIVHDADFVVFE